MGIADLRIKWEKSITQVDDRFLRMIDALYASYNNEINEEEVIKEIPQEIQDVLVNSLNEIKKGSFLEHKDVLQKARDRYNLTK